ncbi:MAG: putative signal transducing protein [Flavobacteriales bacterium]
MEKNWTKIFVSTNPNLVDLLVILLEEKEITAVSINKKDSSYTIFGNIELYVKDTDMEESKEIINSYNERNS